MDIKESPSGKVINALAGYQAFIPNPLPPKFEWDNALVKSLSRADHILGMLSREGAKLPNPHLLMRPFIAREAVLSSKIEGTQATLGEILAQEAGANVDRNPNDLQEVRNYIAALEYGLERLKSFPLSLQLLKEIHGKLMLGVRGSHATPGEFRRVQNWIGSPGCTINSAKYVPPTPGELMDCLYFFEKFLHDRTLPPLIHIALCHYQFEAIHPFLDGNGRIGRLLITLLLIERKLLSSPLLYLSAFFEATQSEYYTQLYNISSKGTWHDWFSYFLNGVALQSLDVLSRAEQINNLITGWQSSKTEGVASDIIRYLAVNPYFTIKRIVENLGVAFTTAQRAVMKLEDLGIVSQTSEGKRDRVYCATDILKILEGSLTPNTRLSDYDI
ncbi:Fic family protein [Candidatus Wolbachia massiliensis]|uniref:Fic family protein n=1 Tax=Candidatus Wolbachia massiliensis TaxID=1845000 RepID=A0A7M3U2Y3_9RICK|nr:Fic/DOC family N-terminal domain-containing protein [Candidatus Wolbachia massiliensis]QOD38768.1 Fic family protein [Candidatus Wolbachia massiliensis]